MTTPRTQRSDAADSAVKRSLVRERAADSAAFALSLASAIERDPSLLDGSARVVAAMARHDAAVAILEKVFDKHAKRYPKSYRAFVDARFRQISGSR